LFVVIFITFKGTLRVILRVIFSDPPCKDMPDFKWYELDINVFVYLNLLSVQTCGFSARVSGALFAYKNNVEIYRNKHFPNQKNDIIFHIFDQVMVLRVPKKIGHCYFCMEGHLKLRLQSL